MFEMSTDATRKAAPAGKTTVAQRCAQAESAASASVRLSATAPQSATASQTPPRAAGAAEGPEAAPLAASSSRKAASGYGRALGAATAARVLQCDM